MPPASSLFDLTGRVALVTGASSGLGVTFAEALAEAGADVVLTARRLDRLEAVAERISSTTGRRAVPLACDVTDAEQVEAATEAAVRELGRIDVLVANAGAVPEGFSMPERLPAELFEQSVRVNLTGTWLTCQSVGRRMLAAGSGSIIVLSSYTGLAGVPFFPPAYQASKAALVNVAQSLAVSWADRGVRVNAIAPGWFPSEMTDAVLAAPVFRERIERQAPLGRTGHPDELVGALLLLASDAGSYITGATIPVDGGTSAVVGQTPYSAELFGLHDAVMPAGLGSRLEPDGSAR
ncbi:MAG: SDR family NAD(P)-dependent oxidoreductase [Thermoleophilia bacterium]